MRYFAFIAVGSTLYNSYTPPTPSNLHASVENAKAAITTTVGAQNMKGYFQNGYTAYIIDTEAQQIVSIATLPVPTLKWQDNPGSSKK